jgi:hypothetical protein
MVRSMKAVAAGMTALAISAAVPAAAQPIDLLGPSTMTAPPSDIAPSDTRSATALRLPGPPLPSSESPRALLEAARQALDAGRIGQAQEALDRAETALLNGSGAPVTASPADTQHAILAIGAARHRLAARDRQGAIRAIDDALTATTLAVRVATPSPPPEAPPQPRPAQPIVTYALLPGHWQLQGAQYVWVPHETVPRPVAHWRFVQGRYVWGGGEWIWVPAHYE